MLMGFLAGVFVGAVFGVLIMAIVSYHRLNNSIDAKWLIENVREMIHEHENDPLDQRRLIKAYAYRDVLRLIKEGDYHEHEDTVDGSH